jgi:hypothetical protein
MRYRQCSRGHRHRWRPGFTYRLLSAWLQSKEAGLKTFYASTNIASLLLLTEELARGHVADARRLGTGWVPVLEVRLAANNECCLANLSRRSSRSCLHVPLHQQKRLHHGGAIVFICYLKGVLGFSEAEDAASLMQQITKLTTTVTSPRSNTSMLRPESTSTMLAAQQLAVRRTPFCCLFSAVML